MHCGAPDLFLGFMKMSCYLSYFVANSAYCLVCLMDSNSLFEWYIDFSCTLSMRRFSLSQT